MTLRSDSSLFPLVSQSTQYVRSLWTTINFAPFQTPITKTFVQHKAFLKSLTYAAHRPPQGSHSTPLHYLFDFHIVVSLVCYRKGDFNNKRNTFPHPNFRQSCVKGTRSYAQQLTSFGWMRSLLCYSTTTCPAVQYFYRRWRKQYCCKHTLCFFCKAGWLVRHSQNSEVAAPNESRPSVDQVEIRLFVCAHIAQTH